MCVLNSHASGKDIFLPPLKEVTAKKKVNVKIVIKVFTRFHKEITVNKIYHTVILVSDEIFCEV